MNNRRKLICALLVLFLHGQSLGVVAGPVSSSIVAGAANRTPYGLTLAANSSVGTDAASATSRNLAPIPPSVPCSAAPLALSMAASRNSGVAPLSVFFDTTGTTSTATTQAFHEIEYRWNFGDPTAGAWNYGAVAGLSRNSATGPVAAHVFETPGTYTVAVTAVDGTNTASCGVEIAVYAPEAFFAGGNTVCIAATSDPVPGTGGCPAGAAHFQQSSWPTIVNAYAKTGKRVLLQRGDTFTGPATARLSATGPGIIGAFGVGAKPKIQTTGIANYSVMLNITASDWRLMDLNFDGQSDVHRQAIAGNNFDRILMLRLSLNDVGGGIELGLNTSSVPDQLALVDSTIQRLKGGSPTSNSHGILALASRFAIMGNLFDDSTGGNAEHMIRIPFMDRGVISNNQIQNVHTTKEMLTLRAPCQAYTARSKSPCTSNNYFGAQGIVGKNAITRKVVIADNYVKTNTYVGISLDAVNATDLAGFKDIIIERNFIQSVTGGGTAVSLSAGTDSVTVRNNIADTTNNSPSFGHVAYAISSPNTSLAPNNIWFYNNVSYDGAATMGIVSVRVRTGATNVTAKNNLAYAPNGTGPVLLSDSTGAVTTCVACNSSNSQVKNTLPFAVATPVSPSDFAAASYAIGGGTGVPVWSDFFRRTKPSPRDMGAVAR